MEKGTKLYEVLIVWGIALAISGMIGGYCWSYSINEWLVFLDKEPSVTFWQGFALGFIPILGQASIPVAVVTWVLMAVL